jgi:cytochrome d ubiquinol oxidase subunit I
MLDTIALSRLQFAATTIYHFLFVPLTLGLSILVAFLQTRYYKTNNEHYKKLTKYFGGLFLINFSMGVATGIVQEFQFGMNWSSYSRFVGDIFGAPLAIEALAAFFIESTFLGLWIFGWDKLPKKLHLASIWLVAAASSLSAFWIIAANAFMQEPVGYAIRNGRAEMVDFFALIKNPQLWLEFPHTVFSGFVTAGVFVIGISAYNILKKKNVEAFKLSMKIALIFGGVSLVLVIFVGDAQGKYLVKHQPMKMAAAEAAWETADPAPFNVVAITDTKNQKNDFEISIPNMLSFMSYGKFDGKVLGIKELQTQYEKEYGPGDYIPPVVVSFWSFRVMIGAGMLMLLLIMLAGFYFFRNKLTENKWLLKFLLFMIPLPYLCNSAGWMLTEMGRQPWIINRVLKVSDGISKTVKPEYVLISLIGFVLVYGILLGVDLYLTLGFIKKDISETKTDLKLGKEVDQLWT